MYLYNINHLYYGIIPDQVAFLHQVLKCGTTVFLSIKKKSQGSATPGCTLTHSKAQPLETGPEKHPLQGVDPQFHLICTPPRMATPPGSPQFLVTGGYGPHPRRLIWTPVQGGYHWYHLILSPPQEGFSPGPLTPIVKCFPATRILPVTFVCFLCVSTWRTLTGFDCNSSQKIYDLTNNKYYCNVYDCNLTQMLMCAPVFLIQIRCITLYATNRQDQVFNITGYLKYRIDYFVIQLLSESDKQNVACLFKRQLSLILSRRQN